jgi:predicted naringenin-chalcone synthase
MTKVDQRGSVLLEPRPQASVGQSFYPVARDQDEAGPSTAVRMARYATEANHLAVEAAEASLLDARTTAADVTHLVVATCTGFQAPGVDIDLIERLGLPPQTQRVVVGFMGCHAAINALRVARGLVAAEPDAVVLVVCVELCSLHYQYGWDPDRVVSNALFADGAAATIVRAAAPARVPAARGLRLVASGSTLLPGTREAMTWRVGNHGFQMTLSSEVPHIIERTLPALLPAWLAEQGLDLSAIAQWAVHPGGPRILQAVESALGLPEEALALSYQVLAQHGNMSSATMLFLMQELWRQQRAGPWLALGFGPGLEVEYALFAGTDNPT